MNEVKNEPAPGGRLVGVVVAVTVVLGTLGALNGFPRYELMQTALAVAGVVVALLAAAVSGQRFGGAQWISAALATAALYAAVSAAVGGQAVGFDAFSLVFLVGGAATASACAGERGRKPILVGAAVAAIVTGLIVLLGAFGIDAVPDIPFTTLDVKAAMGPFDDPSILAAWSALALAIGAAMFGLGEGRLGAATVFGAAVCLGAAGFPALIVVVGVAAVVALAMGNGRSAAAAGAGVLVACAMFFATSPSFEDNGDAFGVQQLDTGMDWPYSEVGALEFFTDAAKGYAIAGQPFGHGSGAYAGEIEAHVDSTQGFATEHNDGRPVSRRSTSALLELSGDYGVTVPLALLTALLLALWRRPAAAVPIVVGLGLLGYSPGTFVGPVMLLLGVSVGVQWEAAAADSRSARPVIALLVALGLVASVHQVQTLRWGYLTASAVTFNEHNAGSRETAFEYASQAIEVQTRFQSEMNFGSMRRYQEEPDHAFVRSVFERAVELRPTSVEARMLLADAYARESARAEDAIERLGRVERMLGAAAEIDPNYVQLGILRANAAAAAFEYEAAFEGLEALAERPIPDTRRHRVLVRLGEIYEDAEMPERALSAYERALPLATDPMDLGRLRQLIAGTTQWIETGDRPQVQFADPHLGHNHGGPGEGEHDEEPTEDPPEGRADPGAEAEGDPGSHEGHDELEHDEHEHEHAHDEHEH